MPDADDCSSGCRRSTARFGTPPCAAAWEDEQTIRTWELLSQRREPVWWRDVAEALGKQHMYTIPRAWQSAWTTGARRFCCVVFSLWPNR